ncbi:hypothetical protein ARMSODRAFT_1010054 [Armillaria solidipes]|uniref:Uncharacterized protein n=1 Tax=Armillaria solidipes TaxID=1076256 RepID=A0A2H3AID2_9AGAR|nr:hypothetical protein ARMSODRAFT_1010054 [Armillaria solidipes]
MAGLSLESGLGDVNADVGSRDLQVFHWGHEVRRPSSASLGDADAQMLGIEGGIGMNTRLDRWDARLDGKFSSWFPLDDRNDEILNWSFSRSSSQTIKDVSMRKAPTSTIVDPKSISSLGSLISAECRISFAASLRPRILNLNKPVHVSVGGILKNVCRTWKDHPEMIRKSNLAAHEVTAEENEFQGKSRSEDRMGGGGRREENVTDKTALSEPMDQGPVASPETILCQASRLVGYSWPNFDDG